MSLTELEVVLEQLRNFTWGETPSEMRANFEAGFSMPSHPTATVSEVNCNGVIADLISTPKAAKDKIILYLHGGGFMVGNRKTYRRLASDLSAASNAQVLLIEYRLAPEYPFPAALEDTLIAYNWLIKERGFNSNQIAVAGDSAGGNLALSLLISLRSNCESLPVATLLISPLTDMQRTGKTVQTKAEFDLMVSPQLLDTVVNLYLPDGNFSNPIVSPIFADLSGLPPMLIHVGSQEVLLDDSLRLARQAALSNVSVELKVWKDMIHCLHLFAPILTEGSEAIAQAGDFLKYYLN
ncbi:esterase/lipase [Rivularia sp. PCC 7116]|uniref:alpha/beta hydrolase n=1 Tax=Rivularia sp. PCC 7116 TaxID=373994 RepID=UPI00029EDF0A|nr:alpha/beta hydrolase [Rivularia sp. PCC 7116]AFY58371.1 esterase/lipase [Rivularia sp. PCC 7116]